MVPVSKNEKYEVCSPHLCRYLFLAENVVDKPERAVKVFSNSGHDYCVLLFLKSEPTSPSRAGVVEWKRGKLRFHLWPIFVKKQYLCLYLPIFVKKEEGAPLTRRKLYGGDLLILGWGLNFDWRVILSLRWPAYMQTSRHLDTLTCWSILISWHPIRISILLWYIDILASH